MSVDECSHKACHLCYSGKISQQMWKQCCKLEMALPWKTITIPGDILGIKIANSSNVCTDSRFWFE